MVSIRDIAKQSGYSISTVSRYINKSGYVSKEAAENMAPLSVWKKQTYLS